MIRDVLLIQEYNLITSVNSFFFWLLKIPFLGKIISRKIYKTILKIVEKSSWISLILPFITKVFSKLIFYGIIVAIITKGEFLIKDAEISKSILIYISLITLFGFMKEAFNFYDANQKSYYFIRQFKMSPKSYFIGSFSYSLIVFAITFSITMKIIFSIISINIAFINILAFSILSCSLRIFAALFMLKKNLKDKKLQIYENSIIFSYYILALVILIFNKSILPLLNVNLEVLYNPILLLFGIIIILLSFKSVLKQNNFDEIIYPRLTVDLLSLGNDMDVEFSVVKTEEENIKIGKEDFSNYSGIRYINEIFFKRHENIYKKKTRKPFILKALIYIGISIAVLFIPTNEIELDFLNKAYLVILFASAYYMFSGNFFIKYCFYNMDYPLMKSNFYRKPEHIMESMKIRLVKLLKNNMILFILMIIMIITVNLRFQLGTKHLFLSLSSGILGVLFFSLHYMFAYYIIQPFTKGLKIKNPLYNGLTYIIYMLSYSVITGDYIYLVLIFAVIYIILGFLGLKYLAPKRFKLR